MVSFVHMVGRLRTGRVLSAGDLEELFDVGDLLGLRVSRWASSRFILPAFSMPLFHAQRRRCISETPSSATHDRTRLALPE